MDLGQFSLSIAVKDLQKSRDFYALLGFEMEPGEDYAGAVYGRDWCILSNGKEKLGLFQGMFDSNALTWNPPDVRSIQKRLKEAGVKLEKEADENTTGPASCFLFDPDGNPVLLDQHTP